MSLESTRPGASRAATVTSEGRRVPVGQPSAQGNSGGVSVDSMSGSVRCEGWEVCRSEATQPSAQAGHTGETEAAAAEVGVLHRSVDLWALDAGFREQLRQAAQKAGHLSERQERLRLTAPQGDKPLRHQSPTLTFDRGRTAAVESDSESRIREIRSSGLMRGGCERRSEGHCGLQLLPSHSPTLL